MRHSCTHLLCCSTLHRRGATALDGSTLHPIRRCILHRLVPVDTSAGSNGRHRTADCTVRHRWCHGTLLISLLLINSDQLRRPPVQRPAALQRPRRLARVGRVSKDASASAIGRYPSIGRLPSLAASTIMAIYFRSLHGVQVASRSTNMQFSNNEIISNKLTVECPLQCPLRQLLLST
jgi:hypothetical protein